MTASSYTTRTCRTGLPQLHSNPLGRNWCSNQSRTLPRTGRSTLTSWQNAYFNAEFCRFSSCCNPERAMQRRCCQSRDLKYRKPDDASATRIRLLEPHQSSDERAVFQESQSSSLPLHMLIEQSSANGILRWHHLLQLPTLLPAR